METSRELRDQDILLLCEDLMHVINQAGVLQNEPERSPLLIRFQDIKDQIETERRLIEEVSLPCRLIVEHFSFFLRQMDYTIGFQYAKVQAGRGVLNDLHVGEWGNVTLTIGSVTLMWRDRDVQYMFYPDKVIIRPKDAGKSDISLYFSYAFTYSSNLDKYNDVQGDEQTIYWHDDLNQ